MLGPVPKESWEETKSLHYCIYTFSSHPLGTFEEVDPLPATVAVGRERQGCIHIVRDADEAIRDVSWEIWVQDTIIKPPVLATLRGREDETE